MSVLAFVYTLVASLGWSAFDVSRKRLAVEFSPMVLAVVLFGAHMPVFAAWAAVEGVWFQPGYLGWGVASSVLNIFAHLLFLRAVQVSPLSLTIPMLAFSPVFAIAAGFVTLGEVPDALQLVGVGVVVVGAMLLNAGGVAGGIPAILKKMKAETGTWMMALVALIWAVSSTFDKQATALSGVGLHGFVQNAIVAGALLIPVMLQKRTGEMKRVSGLWLPLIFGVAAGALALGTQFLAFQQAYVSLVEAVKRAIGMGLSLVSGKVFFKETIHPIQWIAVLVLSVGVGLILGITRFL